MFLRDGHQELKAEVREIGKDVRETRAMVERVPDQIASRIEPMRAELHEYTASLHEAIQGHSELRNNQAKVDVKLGGIIAALTFALTAFINFGLRQFS